MEEEDIHTNNLGLSEKAISFLINQMRSPQHGFIVKNRMYRFKTYERCFLASEAVIWLNKNYLFTKDDSIKFLKFLQDMDVFEHVTQVKELKIKQKGSSISRWLFLL
jgi:MarR-like DNA-binding transcriptional regulator SgrR of sgrS sRNA